MISPALQANKQTPNNSSGGLTRRQLVLSGGSAVSLATPACALFAKDREVFWTRPRELWLTRPQTGEGGRFLYYENGVYLPDAYQELCYLFRDVQANVAIPMSVALFDILFGVQSWASENGINTLQQVLSGHRTVRTNGLTEGAARDSEHIRGSAGDVRQPGVTTENLWRMVAYFRAGGAGFYPQKNMVHVDSGRLRHWAGR